MVKRAPVRDQKEKLMTPEVSRSKARIVMMTQVVKMTRRRMSPGTYIKVSCSLYRIQVSAAVE